MLIWGLVILLEALWPFALLALLVAIPVLAVILYGLWRGVVAVSVVVGDGLFAR